MMNTNNKKGKTTTEASASVCLLLATSDETSLNLYFKAVYLEQMILLKTLELSSQHICIFKFLSK